MNPQNALMLVVAVILTVGCAVACYHLRKVKEPSLIDEAKADLDSTQRQFMTALSRQEETDAEIAMLSARMTRLRNFIDADASVQVAPGLANVSEFRERAAA